MTYGLAHVKAEGCAIHPDDTDTTFTDEQYAKQLAAYNKDNNMNDHNRRKQDDRREYPAVVYFKTDELNGVSAEALQEELRRHGLAWVKSREGVGHILRNLTFETAKELEECVIAARNQDHRMVCTFRGSEVLCAYAEALVRDFKRNYEKDEIKDLAHDIMDGFLS